MRIDNVEPFGRFPLAPHQLLQRRTRQEDAIVLRHLGLPRIDRDEWSLTIDGLVGRPLVVCWGDLLRYPKARVGSVHLCCGDALAPLEPTQRVCNLEWGGARLVDVLADCEPSASARFVWSYGADRGRMRDVDVDAFCKDLPLARVANDVLLAYEIDGEPLAPAHGFPVRLVVPGFYATNSVKWIVRMTLAEQRATGPFTTRWYNDPVFDTDGRLTGATTPVWSIAPQSVIVSPAPAEAIACAIEHEVWGWAWADGGVRSVDVRLDDDGWHPAEVEARRGHEWQRFSLQWTPSRAGAITLTSRARDVTGATQPSSGWRNACYEVAVRVSD